MGNGDSEDGPQEVVFHLYFLFPFLGGLECDSIEIFHWRMGPQAHHTDQLHHHVIPQETDQSEQ